MTSTKVTSFATRAYTTTRLPSKAGTSILLLHAGQPRTPFYTRQHLTKLWGNYKVPKFLQQSLTDAYWNSSKLLRKCVTDCETYKTINENADNFATSITKSVSTMTPEFRPIQCQTAFLFDAPQIEEKIESIIQEGADTLIVLSLHPFEVNYLTKPMLSLVQNVLEKRTKPFGSGIDKNPFIRVASNSHVSFNYLPLTNIGTNESIIQYWAEKIRSNLDDYDSVIFTTPLPLTNRRKFVKNVSETARRVMYVLYDSYPRAVPWRISYHASWNQFWPPITRLTLQNQVKDLRKNERNNTFVIPFSELFQNFDTQTILPSLISNHPNVHLLSPEVNDKALIHSITEVVKNSLLENIARKEYASMTSDKIIV